MQVIGARDNCTHRVDLPMPDGRTNAQVMVNPRACPCGAPWIVVEDWLDLPARSTRTDSFWLLDTDPASRFYGHALELPKAANLRSYAQVALYTIQRRTLLPHQEITEDLIHHLEGIAC